MMAQTIWARDALPLIQKDFKPLFRVFLPAADALFLALGIFGLLVGSKVITGLTVPGYNSFWSCTVGASALVAFVGLVWQWHWVEILAKVVLLISLVVYAFLLAFDAATGPGSSGLTLTLALIVALIPLFRIVYLVKQIALDEDMRGKA